VGFKFKEGEVVLLSGENQCLFVEKGEG